MVGSVVEGEVTPTLPGVGVGKAFVCGILALGSACSSDTAPPEATEGPGPTQVAWPSEVSNPSIEVPPDALGLVADGWSLDERWEYGQYGVDDVYLCREQVEWLATGWLALTYERYGAPLDSPSTGVSVYYIDYGSPELQAERLSGLADVDAACEGEQTSLRSWVPPSVPAGLDTVGAQDGEGRLWAVADETRAVLLIGSAVDAEPFSERAVAFLRGTEAP